jgi:hypothetical protein
MRGQDYIIDSSDRVPVAKPVWEAKDNKYLLVHQSLKTSRTYWGNRAVWWDMPCFAMVSQGFAVVFDQAPHG